jgi:hypothetical protein
MRREAEIRDGALAFRSVAQALIGALLAVSSQGVD